MSSTFVYTYFMTDDPAEIFQVAPRHTAHWQGLNLKAYRGGPFGDRSGGLITFEVDDPAQANAAVAADPFMRAGLIDEYWLKEWEPVRAREPLTAR